MKLYLSSYHLGNNPKLLLNLIGENKNVAMIPNAMDFMTDLKLLKEKLDENLNELKRLGLKPEIVDLRNYFNGVGNIADEMSKFGLIWVRGGNTFVLRRAFKQSGFDKWLLSQKNNKDLVYGGYSAGCCVLSPTMKGLDIVDEPYSVPEDYDKEVIWEGLGLIDFVFVPHYKSNHPESVKVDETVEYYQKEGISYKTVRDGEVIITEA
jgi:dipeptidase E